MLASLRRRLAALVYEALLVLAWLFIAGFLVVGVLPETRGAVGQFAFQAYLLTVLGVYCVGFWTRGQTLAMKTWRLHLVTEAGGRLDRRRALIRYGWLVVGFGIGFLWALFDRDRQFLHDRMARTRIIVKT